MHPNAYVGSERTVSQLQRRFGCNLEMSLRRDIQNSISFIQTMFEMNSNANKSFEINWWEFKAKQKWNKIIVIVIMSKMKIVHINGSIFKIAITFGRWRGWADGRTAGRTEQLFCRINVRKVFKQNHLTFDCMQYHEQLLEKERQRDKEKQNGNPHALVGPRKTLYIAFLVVRKWFCSRAVPFSFNRIWIWMWFECIHWHVQRSLAILNVKIHIGNRHAMECECESRIQLLFAIFFIFEWDFLNFAQFVHRIAYRKRNRSRKKTTKDVRNYITLHYWG